MEWHNFLTKQGHKIIIIGVIVVVLKNMIFGGKNKQS